MLIFQVYDQQYITEATKEAYLNLDEKVVSLQKCINQCKHVSISDKMRLGPTYRSDFDENMIKLTLIKTCERTEFDKNM